VFALAAAAAPVLTAAQSGCDRTAVGVDTSLAHDQNALFHGDAIGQTFVARETLITSITVWRPAWVDTSYAGLHIYLLSADSTGHPNLSDILQDGPTLFNLYGDGVHPVPYRFVFDPPITLPAPGRYHFAIQTDPCDGVFYFPLNPVNAYPDGGTWWYAQSFSSPCHLRPNPVDNGTVDLAFEVEFCGPVTPAHRPTWGEVKAAYR